MGWILRRPGRRLRMVVPKRMTEANEQEANEQEQKRPLTLGRGGTRLELRRPVETGQVRQSFSHGRSKTVTVEVRKKRILVPGRAPEPGRAEPAGKAAAAKVAALTAAGKMAMPAEEEEEPATALRPGRRPEIKRPAAPARRDEHRRRTGKLTVTRALNDDAGERMRSLASVRRARERERQRMLQQEQPKIVREVVIPETITIQELANRMAERAPHLIKALIRLGG